MDKEIPVKDSISDLKEHRKAIVSVINDLSTDQRVHKVCLFLLKNGYGVTLVGRKKRESVPLEARPYKTKRMCLLFEKGVLFYAEYNLRLLLLLLFRKAHLLVSNDLDTLLPNFLVSKLKRAKLAYDSHEYFTEVPELEGKLFKKAIWKKIETFCFPKLKNVYTVNPSIAGVYEKEYSVNVRVVRNFPEYKKLSVGATKRGLGLPEGKKIILHQGHVNMDRGVAEAIEAMRYVENAALFIIGGGDVLHAMKLLAHKLNLESKVVFHRQVPFEQLRNFTVHADIGLSLDKGTNINYQYSLPNKIFDYIHCGVPVLSSSLPERKKVFLQYNIGEMTENHHPHHIAEKINYMLSSPDKIKIWKENCATAAKELCWQNEERVLEEVYSSL